MGLTLRAGVFSLIVDWVDLVVFKVVQLRDLEPVLPVSPPELFVTPQLVLSSLLLVCA